MTRFTITKIDPKTQQTLFLHIDSLPRKPQWTPLQEDATIIANKKEAEKLLAKIGTKAQISPLNHKP